MYTLSGSEWKYLVKQLKPLALDRFCRRALAEVARIAENDATGGMNATWRCTT